MILHSVPGLTIRKLVSSRIGHTRLICADVQHAISIHILALVMQAISSCQSQCTMLLLWTSYSGSCAQNASIVAISDSIPPR